jgi:uncharacterized protein
MMNRQVPDVIVQSQPPSGEPLRVFLGFPGSGLVGSIALSYIVEKLGFTQIGVITSKYFPPMAMMTEGIIAVPVRIYEKDAMIAILADIPIHSQICYEVSIAILDWLKPYKIAEVVTIAGIITNELEKRVFCVTTGKELLEKIGENALILPIGSISGIACSILTECKVRGIPCTGLLGETINAPDPRAAAATTEVMNSIYALNVDTAGLLEQAEEIEAQMHRLSQEVQSAEEQSVKTDPLLPMYG